MRPCLVLTHVAVAHKPPISPLCPGRVYAAASRKAELARLLIETAISGDSQAVPANECEYVQAIQAASDAETKIASCASAMRGIAGRLAPVLSIVEQTAPAEQELAALWHQIAERRGGEHVPVPAAVAPLRGRRDLLDTFTRVFALRQAP